MHLDSNELSDIFFSLWLSVISVNMNRSIFYYQSASSFELVPHIVSTPPSYNQYKTSIDFFKHLLHSNQDHSDSIPYIPEQKLVHSLYARSPGVKDDLIFYSNSFVETHQNLLTDVKTSSVRYYDTWRAVDGDLSTCWQSSRDIQSNDFFAIDFLRAQTNITFLLTVKHSSVLQKNLVVSLSFDGRWWLSYRSLRGISFQNYRNLQEDFVSILFDASQFTLGFRSFRYISFKTMNNSNQRFEVCEVELIPQENLMDF